MPLRTLLPKRRPPTDSDADKRGDGSVTRRRAVGLRAQRVGKPSAAWRPHEAASPAFGRVCEPVDGALHGAGAGRDDPCKGAFLWPA
jgi:hypothetical protein